MQAYVLFSNGLNLVDSSESSEGGKNSLQNTPSTKCIFHQGVVGEENNDNGVDMGLAV